MFWREQKYTAVVAGIAWPGSLAQSSLWRNQNLYPPSNQRAGIEVINSYAGNDSHFVRLDAKRQERRVFSQPDVESWFFK